MQVVVIGGGPGGTAAALTLRNAQVPVTIVERESFPRYRPGETLHPGIEPLLSKLGVPENLHGAGYLRQEGIWSDWGKPMRFVPYGEDEHGPWRGFQALRGDFDNRMLQSACHRGAQLISTEAVSVLRESSGAVVGVETSIGPVQGNYVIDCTGGSHLVARHLKIPILRHSPRLVARFGYVRGRFDGPAPSITADNTGWTWIAEVEPERFQWTRVTEARDRPDATWVPDCLSGLKAEASYGADVTWRMAQTVAGPGWFLAGDAAVVLDPSSSHGVLRAVMTGMMAAHLVVQRLRHGAAADACSTSYQHWLSDWFQHDATEMTRAYGMANLFGFRTTVEPNPIFEKAWAGSAFAK